MCGSQHAQGDSASLCTVRRSRKTPDTPRNFMHENRETSKTPAANLGRSAGEGSGHTARMHVSEESHRGIVPIEVDSPYALVRVLPLSSSPVCPRFLRPHRGFSC